jgi:hypothetical protein
MKPARLRTLPLVNPSLLPLAAGLFILAGCFEVEVPITRTRTGIVEGNPTLHAAHAVAYSALVDPITIHEPDKVRKLDSLRLDSVVIVATDAAAPAGDQDELRFIQSIDLFVEPQDPASALPRKLVARYLPEEAGELAAPDLLYLEVVDSVNFKHYVREGCRLVLESAIRIPPDDVGIRVEAEFLGIHEVL